MADWISAINNALKSTIESGKSVTSFDASKIETNSSQVKAIQSALTGKHSHSLISHGSRAEAQSSSNSNLHRRTTVGARPTVNRRASSQLAENPEKLLQMVREADPSNSSCADCGSTVKAEWVSINLGIVLCIGTLIAKPTPCCFNWHCLRSFRMQWSPPLLGHAHLQGTVTHSRHQILYTRSHRLAVSNRQQKLKRGMGRKDGLRSKTGS